MIADGRVAAWVASWQNLEAAEKLLKQIQSDAVDGLVGALMESFVSRAAIYASLAAVPKAVGLGAGDWLVQEQERKAEHERMMTRIKEKLQGDINGRP